MPEKQVNQTRASLTSLRALFVSDFAGAPQTDVIWDVPGEEDQGAIARYFFDIACGYKDDILRAAAYGLLTCVYRQQREQGASHGYALIKALEETIPKRLLEVIDNGE